MFVLMTKQADWHDPDPQARLVAAIEAGRCPMCGHQLTDPARNSFGWAWCRNPRCRRPWAIWREHERRYAVTLSPAKVKELFKTLEPDSD